MKEMKAKGQDIFQSMTSAMIQTVFEELDIVRYSLNPQCDRKAGVYENAVGGWNSGNIQNSCSYCLNHSLTRFSVNEILCTILWLLKMKSWNKMKAQVQT